MSSSIAFSQVSLVSWRGACGINSTVDCQGNTRSNKNETTLEYLQTVVLLCSLICYKGMQLKKRRWCFLSQCSVILFLHITLFVKSKKKTKQATKPKNFTMKLLKTTNYQKKLFLLVQCSTLKDTKRREWSQRYIPGNSNEDL